LKKFVSLIILMLFLSMLAACGNSESAGGKNNDSGGSDVIKIGAIYSASGGGAPLGKSQMETVKMLVEQVNENDGIDGKKIELIAYDDKSDQNEAVLSMKKLIEQDKVLAVVGGTLSGNALAMVPLAEKSKTPFIASATSKQIVKPDDNSSRDWIFKTTQSDDVVIPKILAYLKEKNLTKIAWLNVANQYGTSAHEEFNRLKGEYGIEAVIEEEFEATVDDAKAMLTRVKKSNPQAIIVWGTAQESSVITKNLHQLGMKLPIIESQGIGTKEFIELTGEAAEGVIFPAGRLIVAEQLPDNDPQKETLIKYKEDFKAKFNYDANTFGGHTWDAFYLLVNAIEKAGTDKEKIREQLENTKNFVGISGIFNFSKDNHTGLDESSLVMVQIKDGKFVIAE
jgi:branched-chain amino acid transport system substrate-binding protein